MNDKSLIIVYSYHHKNTEKIAKVMANVLNAELLIPQQIEPEHIQSYDLVGFGSGIYGEKHHEFLFDLVERLPKVNNKNAFIFSTSAIMGKRKVAKDHSLLRKKLHAKGFFIVDEFSCEGFNTNSFLKFFGGMNKGRPNVEDLKNAEEFALNLKQKILI